ncbi:MAG: ElyC/SanA/YdcF family protein [Planctomycetota bacterium]
MDTPSEGATTGGAAPTRRWRRRLLWAAIAFVAAMACMHEHVVRSARPWVFAAESVPAADCILVPGARIHVDGQPFPLLVDRLTTALGLFSQGKAPRIVVSGRGGGSLGEDEVGAMRRWLVQRGVPEGAVLDDPLGLRTLDSMRRCGSVFGARSAIVVSNPFHVPRSVFLGRQCGLDVCGVAAPYGADYSTATMFRNQGREVMARIWAWLDVFVFGAA